MQLPRLSPTALHWVTLAGSVFLGGVTSAIAQDGTPMQVIADLGDPTKRGAIVTGAVVAGALAVCALVQRSVLPIVSARAVAQNAVQATMKGSDK
jgi:hypothetical protein